MARIILEDMKLNKERRTNIPKKEEVSFSVPDKKEKKLEEEYKEELNVNEFLQKKNNGGQKLQKSLRVKSESKIISKKILIIFILFSILGGIYWGGNFFQKANVDITSKHQFITYKNKQFTAIKDEASNNINFEIMITSNKKSVNLILTEPKEVSIKAEGSITLYNEFSTKAEKLSVGTFVSDENGKTYKINNTVSIPGYKTVDKKVVPGQINVNITSFLVGDVYNGSPTDFKINTFKGTTKYNKIYGKLKSPLVGGASGLVYTLDDKSIKNIENIANTSLKEDLLTQVKTLVPSDYVIYPGSVIFSYDISENILSKTPEANIEINGTLAVVLLKEKSLRDQIIKVSLLNIKDGELKEIKILNLDKLVFNFVDKNQVITKNMDSVLFTLSGDLDAVWIPDIEILKNKLIGVHKDDVLSILRQDPGIAQALVKIFPPWQKNIPNNPLNIDIKLK